MFDKKKVAALVAEFLGTGFLTLIVLSVQRSTIGVPFFVAMIAGLASIVMVFAFSDVSGAFLNPAVALGLWTARRLSTLRTVVLVAMELLGAWVAYYVYTYLVNTHLSDIGGHFSGRTLAAEAVGAGVLGMAWAAASFGHWAKGMRAAAVGVAFMLAMVIAATAGIGLANPALALGVRAWVWGTYVAGPVIGTVVGINLYGLLFAEGGLNFSFSAARPDVVKPTSTVAAAKSKSTTKKTSSRGRRSSK